MKKIKLIKPLLLLFAVFTFSMCDETGDIQFEVKNSFETTATVAGLEGQSTFTIDSTADISDLLDNATTFVDANIESVILQLEDYSGSDFAGNISIAVGPVPFLNQSVSLSSTPTDPIIIPENAARILYIISSGSFPFTITGSTTNPIEDNNFKIKMTFKIKAIVE
ncbi:hypothetical protein [Polaribacter sp.]|uniref:hypothetical protein n=1 Tax=Polaribacter sp. TaxID=1920175 RepID=UPI003F6CF725